MVRQLIENSFCCKEWVSVVGIQSHSSGFHLTIRSRQTGHHSLTQWKGSILFHEADVMGNTKEYVVSLIENKCSARTRKMKISSASFRESLSSNSTTRRRRQNMQDRAVLRNFDRNNVPWALDELNVPQTNCLLPHSFF